MKKTIFIFLLFSAFSFGQDAFLFNNKDRNENAGVVNPPTGSIVCATCDNIETSLSWDVADEYTPTSAADLTNASNAGKTALISNSFSVSGSTFAANQIIVPRGGQLSGTGVNLNGSVIALNDQRAFSTSFRLSSVYGGCLSPEMFGAALTSDDTNAIDAMILNSNKGFNKSNENYTITSGKSYAGNRVFKWNGNGSTIRSTFDNKASSQGGSQIYLYDFDGVKPEICNLEIDGQDISAFGLQISHSGFLMKNFNLHDFKTDGTGRCLGVQFNLYSADADEVIIEDSFFNGFENIASNNPSGADGLSRAIIVYYEEANTPRNFYITNTDMSGAWGNGEAIHLFPSGAELANHDIIWFVEDCDFWDNDRRDIKCQTSGMKINNSRFVAVDESLRNIPLGATSNVSFSLNDTPTSIQYHRNSSLTNCTFTTANGGSSSFVGLSDVRDFTASGNTFTFPEPSTSAAVNFGGKQLANVFTANNFVNSGFSIANMSSNTGTVEAHTNTISYTINSSVQSAVIRLSSTLAVTKGFDFHNNNVTLTFNASSGNFYGLYGAHLSASQSDGITIRDNSVLYQGPSKSGQKFITVGGDFDSANTVRDNVVTGITTTNAIKIDGVQTFVNINNVDENGTPLTVQ